MHQESNINLSLIVPVFNEKNFLVKLFEEIKNYFDDKCYQFFNWKKYCPELFSIENYLSKKKPSKLAILNINKAKTIYKYFKIFSPLSIILFAGEKKKKTTLFFNNSFTA